jgi:hypothetical protein
VEPKTPEAADLLAKLARDLSALVRRDVEVAAAERLPGLRRALVDGAAVAVVAVAALLTLAALSVAGGRAAEAALPGWAAALLVAGAWASITALAAAVLVRPRARPRESEELLGLLQILARNDRLEEVQSSRRDARAEAEDEVRRTSAALVSALLEEAAEHQLAALPALAKRQAGKAEADAAALIAEALAVLTAPARAGLSALGRLVDTTGSGPAREEDS